MGVTQDIPPLSHGMGGGAMSQNVKNKLSPNIVMQPFILMKFYAES